MAQILRGEKLKIVNKIAGSDIVLFENLTFFIDEKEWVNFSLPHGSGKTILYRIILNQEKPTSGKIIFNNKEKLDEYDREQFIKNNITAVPELPSLVNEFTVKDWTRLQMEILRPKKSKERLNKFYAFLKDEDIEIEKHLIQLTLLEIRKVEIAFSIVADSILIICDDIDVGLSKEDQENLAIYLKKINKDRAILTLSSDVVWNKYAKKVVRI
jgi:ABC-type lipoprotein export system ATPase subunit